MRSASRGWWFGQDVCFSLPSVVSARGIERVLPLQLSAEEEERLRRSAAVLKGVVATMSPKAA